MFFKKILIFEEGILWFRKRNTLKKTSGISGNGTFLPQA